MQWRDADWLKEADAWIRAQVGTPTGAVTQPHVRPWATVMKVPTAEGVLWFKANGLASRFEAALDAELAARFPDLVGEVVAVEPERGWMLLRDAGTRLRELEPDAGQLACWEQLLPRYAELQLELGARCDELAALGVPDLRLARLPERLAELLADETALQPGSEDDLTEDELASVRAEADGFAALCDELAGRGIAETLQHDDLHDGQVFVRDGCHRILDWGDSCVSHPFHTLVVTLRALAWRLGLQPGGRPLERLRDAYLEPFSRVAPRDELVETARLAHRTGTIARAIAWYGYLRASDRNGDLDPDDAASVPYGLKLYLADGPIGTWEPPARW